MIKVLNCVFDPDNEVYVLSLEDGDQVIIKVENYNRIMNHVSENGKVLKAVVDEHEDDYSAAIEYLGFEKVA
jgi:hypothetical protein